ncbi:pepsin A-like [Gigaspora margarita]|uniref:Pepsin A-like n=1 Tax=Gigaspora margarita TaxID=4874 RepID=A0A8H4B1Y3_GIGMA|nr:pepsin A-like [Gigaspora margarita]
MLLIKINSHPAEKRLLGRENLTKSNIVGYYREITIGNQAFKTLFDLGSSDNWISFKNCDCSNQKQFNQSLSKTFNPIGNPFFIEYIASIVAGNTGKDNVLVGRIETVDQIFGLVTAEEDIFAELGFDSIFGMGFNHLNAMNATTPFSNMVEL